MTRTRTIATLWCTALVATLTAYGCGSSSTVDTGTGGKSGTAGGSGTGSGGGIVIITNVGGMTGTAGMTGGGTGGTTGPGQDAGGPPVDAGPQMCAQNAMCTAGFTCTATCNAGGGRGPGTQMCTCRNTNRLNCGACTPNNAGVVPPVDAAPRDVAPPVDAGPACPANTQNNRACMVGVSPSPCARNVGGGNIQTCTCADVVVPDAGADAAVIARYTCM